MVMGVSSGPMSVTVLERVEVKSTAVAQYSKVRQCDRMLPQVPFMATLHDRIDQHKSIR